MANPTHNDQVIPRVFFFGEFWSPLHQVPDAFAISADQRRAETRSFSCRDGRKTADTGLCPIRGALPTMSARCRVRTIALKNERRVPATLISDVFTSRSQRGDGADSTCSNWVLGTGNWVLGTYFPTSNSGIFSTSS